MVFTVLGEFSGAGEGGDLEAVFGDGDPGGVVVGLPQLGFPLLHLHQGPWESQVRFSILSLLHVHLRQKWRSTAKANSEPYRPAGSNLINIDSEETNG